jgi:hypothetical protein
MLSVAVVGGGGAALEQRVALLRPPAACRAATFEFGPGERAGERGAPRVCVLPIY